MDFVELRASSPGVLAEDGLGRDRSRPRRPRGVDVPWTLM